MALRLLLPRRQLNPKAILRVLLGSVALLVLVSGVVSAASAGMIRAYQNDLRETATLQYSRSVQALDRELNAFAAAAREMYTDRDLKQKIFEEQPFEAMQSAAKLRLYLNGMSMAGDLFISFRADRLQTPKGHCATAVYAARTLNLTPESAQALTSAVAQRPERARLVLTDRSGGVGLMYLFTSPESKQVNQINQITVGVWVPAANIEQKIWALFSAYTSISAFTLDTGEVIVRTDNLTEPDPRRDEICDTMSAGRELHNSRYVVVRCPSDEWAYTLNVAVSTAQLWRRQRQMQQSIFCGGGIALAVLAAGLFLMNYHALRPMIAALRVARKYFDGDAPQKLNSEFDLIRAALEKGIALTGEQAAELQTLSGQLKDRTECNARLEHELQSASARLAQQEAALAQRTRDARQNAVRVVLSGTEPDDARLSTLLGGMDAPFYAVLAVETDDSAALCLALAQTEAFAQAAPVQLRGRSAVAAIVSLTDADRTGLRRTELGVALRRMADTSAAVCAGTAVGARSEIAQSCREAEAALDADEDFDRSAPVRLFDTLAQRKASGTFPPELLPALRDAVAKRQLPEFKRRLAEWTAAYCALPPTGEQRRFQRYALVAAVQEALGERMTVSAEKRLLQLPAAADDSFAAQLSAVVRPLLDPRPTHHGKALQQQLLDYVNRHYLQFDIAVEQVADRFQVSRQTVNAMMKSAVKLTYSEYVTKLRFERACALLQDPTVKVQDVAQQVGYVDARSFIRKFKGYYGITPGEYQQECAARPDHAPV